MLSVRDGQGDRSLTSAHPRHKQKKRVLREALKEVVKDNHDMVSHYRCLEETRAVVEKDLAAQGMELDRTKVKLKKLQRDHAKACRQRSRLLSLSFKTIMEAQHLKGLLQRSQDWVDKLSQQIFEKNNELWAQDLRIRGLRLNLESIGQNPMEIRAQITNSNVIKDTTWTYDY